MTASRRPTINNPNGNATTHERPSVPPARP
jgi:hypothetical protein